MNSDDMAKARTMAELIARTTVPWTRQRSRAYVSLYRNRMVVPAFPAQALEELMQWSGAGAWFAWDTLVEIAGDPLPAPLAAWMAGALDGTVDGTVTRPPCPSSHNPADTVSRNGAIVFAVEGLIYIGYRPTYRRDGGAGGLSICDAVSEGFIAAGFPSVGFSTVKGHWQRHQRWVHGTDTEADRRPLGIPPDRGNVRPDVIFWRP